LSGRPGPSDRRTKCPPFDPVFPPFRSGRRRQPERDHGPGAHRQGYVVDVGKADPYTLRGLGDAPATARPDDLDDASDLGDDVIRGPVVIVDRNGKVVRIVRN